MAKVDITKKCGGVFQGILTIINDHYSYRNRERGLSPQVREPLNTRGQLIEHFRNMCTGLLPRLQ